MDSAFCVSCPQETFGKYGTLETFTTDQGLREYFRFYNAERLHQPLNYLTPDDIYASAADGGAMIVEKIVESGQHHSAA